MKGYKRKEKNEEEEECGKKKRRKWRKRGPNGFKILTSDPSYASVGPAGRCDVK